MQVSNSLSQHQNVFEKFSNVSVSVNNNSKEKSFPSPTVSSSNHKSLKKGVSIAGLTDLSYKSKLMSSSDFKALGLKDISAHFSSSTSSGGSPQEIQKYKNYWADKANDKNTQTLIRIRGDNGDMEIWRYGDCRNNR